MSVVCLYVGSQAGCVSACAGVSEGSSLQG